MGGGLVYAYDWCHRGFIIGATGGKEEAEEP
jgi:hypothetical protein